MSHCFIFLVILAIVILLYQVRNYLNSKPLGQRTVLDNLAKDGMTILALRLSLNWITLIKVVPEYNYYVALMICQMKLFLGMTVIIQCATFSAIRYLFIFHFDFINTKDEKKVKMINRICVTVLALICTIVDDSSKNRQFLYLIHSQFKHNDDQKKIYKGFASSLIISSISILIIVIVQIRIICLKWNTPEPLKKYNWDFFNWKTVSLALFIVVFSALLLISTAFMKFNLLSWLMSIYHTNVIIFVIIFLLVKSNNRMYAYVKKKIIPEFIQKDLEMYRNIYSKPTPEHAPTLPCFSNTINNEMPLNTCNPAQSQSNQGQTLNCTVAPKSIDHLSATNLPIEINVPSTSKALPYRTTNNSLPDVSV